MIDPWSEIKFFTFSEFDDPTERDSGKNMNPEFIKILDKIRASCAFGFHIDSGFRTPVHNISVGGKNDSAHMKGVAADIFCPDSTQRFAIIKFAIINGINRIGIGDSFVHLDLSLDLPQAVLWLYPPKATAQDQQPK